MATRTYLPREALYELVWSKPMRTAAAELGLSDVGLKKRCRSWAIPVPPQGYWNKAQAGHRLPPRPPLPAAPEAPSVVRAKQANRKPIETPAPARKPLRIKSRRVPFPRDRDGRVIRGPNDWIKYAVRIVRWAWEYEFGVNEDRYASFGNFSEFRSLVIEGTFLEPVELIDEAVKVYLTPGNYEAWSRVPPTKVGQILRNGDGEYLLAFIGFPRDTLPLILQMLVAGRYQNVVLKGGRWFRGEVDLRSFGFEGGVDREAR